MPRALTRQCSGDGCTKPIYSENTSGMCRPCLNRAVKLERKCSDCGSGISRHSRSGRCNLCSNRNRAPSQPTTPFEPRYCGCGAVLSRNKNARQCFACYAASVAPLPSPEPARAWCTQCERNVLIAEARQCASRWCGAKEAA